MGRLSVFRVLADRVWPTLRDNALSVAGLAALDVSAFLLSTAAGWAAVGVSLLVIEFVNDRGRA